MSKAKKWRKITPEVLRELESYFMMGMSDRQACLKAMVAYSTFTDYCMAHDDFRTKKEALKENPKLLVKEIIYKELVEGDLDTAKWYAERKMKDEGFSTRQEIEHSGEIKMPTIIIE